MTLQSNEDIAAREYVKASGFRNAGQRLNEVKLRREQNCAATKLG